MWKLLEYPGTGDLIPPNEMVASDVDWAEYGRRVAAKLQLARNISWDSSITPATHMVKARAQDFDLSLSHSEAERLVRTAFSMITGDHYELMSDPDPGLPVANTVLTVHIPDRNVVNIDEVVERYASMVRPQYPEMQAHVSYNVDDSSADVSFKV